MASPIVISILANASQAKSELNDTATTAQRVGDGFRRMALPATVALGAIAVGTKSAIDAASDLREEVSKSGVIFGDQASEIERFASTADEALGQSKRAALEAAGTFGTIAKSAGLAGPDVSGFSTKFTTLASDMASFSNTTPEEAVNAIGAAMRGESEPIRKYGVMLDDATLRARALSMGLIDSVSQGLTPQQKALAASEEILAQTSQAQGDFARTSEGAANQSRINAAEAENLRAKLGDQLLPIYERLQRVLSTVLNWMSKHQTTTKVLIGVVAGLAAGVLAVNAAMSVAGAATAVYTLVMGRNTGAHRANATASLASRVGTVAGAAATTAASVATKAATAAQWLWNAALTANPIGLIIVGILALIAGFVLLWKNSETFRDIVLGVWEAVKTATGVLVDAVKAYVGLVIAYWTGVWEAIKWVIDKVVAYYTFLITKGWELYNGIVNAFGAAISWVQGIPGKITSAIGDLGGLLKNAGKKVIDGFINGIESKFNSVKNKLGDLTSKLTSWKGPPRTDARILRDNGALVIDGFITGLESRYSGVRKSLNGLTRDVARTEFTAPSINDPELLTSAAVNGGRGVTVQKNYNISLSTLVPTAESGRVIIDAIRDYERLGGTV